MELPSWRLHEGNISESTLHQGERRSKPAVLGVNRLPPFDQDPGYQLSGRTVPGTALEVFVIRRSILG